MKTLILALGNPIVSDDRVAFEVADRLGKALPQSSIPDKQFDIVKASAATMDIIPKLVGYDRLMVLDAVQFGTAPVGTVHRFNLADLASTIHLSSPHDINFATALQMGKEWGYYIPKDIRIYGIEVKELLKFSESCTPEVNEKLDNITEFILNDLSKNQTT
jgi:hydrogenase maturation protease